MRRTIPALLAALLIGGQASAQSIPKQLWSDVKAGASDVIRIWDAPIHTDADDLPAIGALVVATGLAAAVDKPVARWFGEDGVQGKILTPFREGHPLLEAGSGTRITNYSAATYAVGLLVRSRVLREAGMGCLASTYASSQERALVYKLVSRPRPSAPNPDPYDIRFPGGSWDYHSFFGGHAANAMNCATFLAQRFDMGWYGVPLYALGAGVSLGRIADQRHWPSDIVLGVAYGYATGALTAKRWKQRDAKRAGESDAADKQSAPPVRLLYLAPAAGGGVAAGWEIRLKK